MIATNNTYFLGLSRKTHSQPLLTETLAVSDWVYSCFQLVLGVFAGWGEGS
jgi:hypothetical protein